MQYFNGCTYGFMSPRGFTQREGWQESMEKMVESTGCDTLLLAVGALQDHAYSVQVDFETPDVMSMDDVRNVCAHARKLGLKLILKAMVNCRDGYWRAYIHFIDNYVPSEPTWGQWFDSYGRFVCELAKVAQEVNAEMFCVGCEMVGADHRAEEWRKLVADVRTHYTGHVTYNCDKYQEDRVTWWDALDSISASGYYPIDALEENFQRIKEVTRRFDRPFLFMESGCPSRAGSEYIPNNWSYGGPQNLKAQEDWYQAFAEALLRHPWVRGCVWWDWSATRLYPLEKAATDDGYCVYGKPTEAVLKRYTQAIRAREESQL